MSWVVGPGVSWKWTGEGRPGARRPAGGCKLTAQLCVIWMEATPAQPLQGLMFYIYTGAMGRYWGRGVPANTVSCLFRFIFWSKHIYFNECKTVLLWLYILLFTSSFYCPCVALNHESGVWWLCFFHPCDGKEKINCLILNCHIHLKTLVNYSVH